MSKKQKQKKNKTETIDFPLKKGATALIIDSEGAIKIVHNTDEDNHNALIYKTLLEFIAELIDRGAINPLWPLIFFEESPESIEIQKQLIEGFDTINTALSEIIFIQAVDNMIQEAFIKKENKNEKQNENN
ncbi:MAG: hypothetical protein ACP6IQ_02530 [Candidatus Njordarchaeia archaeon]